MDNNFNNIPVPVPPKKHMNIFLKIFLILLLLFVIQFVIVVSLKARSTLREVKQNATESNNYSKCLSEAMLLSANAATDQMENVYNKERAECDKLPHKRVVK